MANNGNVIDIKKEVSEIVALFEKQNVLLKEASNLANEFGRKLPTKPSDIENQRAKSVEKLNAVERERLNIQNQIERTNAKIAVSNEENTRILTNQKSVLKSLNGAYAELSEKHKKAGQTLRDLIAQGVKAGQTQKQYNRELANAKREYDQLDAKIIKANRTLNRFNDNVGNYPKLAGGVRDLMGAFGIATGLYLAVDIGRNIFNTTRELQSLDLALKNVTETQSNFAEQQAFIGATAEKYGLEINSLTKQFTQFYVSAKGKLANNEIQQIFEDTASAVSALGLPLENQERAFYAMNQMMSKGTVQAEELRGQLGDAIPGAFKTMVKAYNELHPKQQVTEQQFANLMKKGKILASEILPEFAKQLKEATGGDAGAGISTLNKEINKLSNEWILFVRSLSSSKNEIGSFFSFFLEVLRTDLKALREFFDEYNINWKGIILPTMLVEKDMYRQREKQLNGIYEVNKKTSQSSLKYMTDEIQKQKYITEGIKTHSNEIKNLQEEYSKLKQFNKSVNINNRFDNGLYSAENKGDYEKFKNNKKRMSEIAEQIMVRKGLIAGLTTSTDKLTAGTDKETGTTEKNIKTHKEKIALNFKEIDSLYQLRKAKAELNIEENKDDESKTYQERLALLKAYTQAKLEDNELYFDHQTALALKSYADDMEKNNLAFKNKEISQNEFSNNISDITATLNNTLERLDIERSNKSKEILDSDVKSFKEMKKTQANITFEMNQRIIKDEQDKYKAIADNERYSMTAREEAFKKWLKLEKKRLEIEKELKIAQEQDPLKKQSIAQEYDLLISKLGELETPLAKFKQQINDAFKTDAIQKMNEQLKDLGFKSLSKIIDFTVTADGKIQSTFTKQLEALKGTGKEWTVYAGAIAGVMQDAYNLMNQSNQAYFDEQKARVEAQYEYQLQFANGNAEAERQLQEDLAKRKREIANQEAKARKEQAIFNIIMNTAQGVTSALASYPPNFILAGIIGALGIAQLAMVNSAKTPQYFKGRKGGKAELAMTDERGAELHTDKYGNIKDWGTDKGARYKWLDEGDTIFTASETLKYQKAFADNVSTPKPKFTNETHTTIIREQVPTQNVAVNIDKNGIRTTITELSKTAEVHNNYYRIKGYKA